MARPTEGGGIRCRIENLPELFGNAGFDIHLGSLGSVAEVTVQSKTIQTEWTETGGNAMIVAALYFDVDDDDEFFVWKDAQGNTESWVDFGEDTERGLATAATGSFTIDDATELPVFADNPEDPPTLGEIKAGDAIPGVDENTDTALYLGVGSPGGEPSGTEELVVRLIDVTRK